MLEVEGITTHYGEVEALHQVSFHVEEGEVVTLLGGNGAGKSTTLRTVSGLLRPTAGQVRLGGKSIIGLPPQKIARLGVVHVPEGRQIIGGLSVLDNLMLGTSNGRLHGSAVAEALEQVFEVFPRLRDLAGQLGWTLSGGEQQMLALGRAMMAAPRVLLLDEPSLGLAPLIVRDVFRVIGRLHDEGATVLVVEQNAYQALRVADRGYVLATGSVVHEGPAQELLDSDRMRDAYLGRGGHVGPAVVDAVLEARGGHDESHPSKAVK